MSRPRTVLLVMALALVVGVFFVVIGVFEIVSSFGIRKASKQLGS